MNGILRALIREEVKKAMYETNVEPKDIDLDDLDDEENDIAQWLPDEVMYIPGDDPRYKWNVGDPLPEPNMYGRGRR